MTKSRKVAATLLLGAFLAAPLLPAQNNGSKLFSDMRWREIGPYRGGRTRALSGVPLSRTSSTSAPCNGGVWKSTDYGRTWDPIFDDQPTGSIGAIAVAPSNPNIIYVGSGEGLQRPDLSTGDGIYKSTDAGRTWTASRSPRWPADSADRRRSARSESAIRCGAGHPYGPNEERGIFRSTDGGKTFQKVFTRTRTPAPSMSSSDPSNPRSRIRRAVGSAPRPLGKRRVEWHGCGFSNPPTAAKPGNSSRKDSRLRARPRPNRLAIAPAMPIGFMPPSRQARLRYLSLR